MIHLQQLTFPTAGAGTPVLDEICLSIHPGERVALVGGSGASALLRILAGLESDWRGEVELFARPLRSWGKTLYERIGISIAPDLHYEALSARENLEFFASLYRVRTCDPLELLNKVGLGCVADRPLGDLDHDQRRRLSLIRGLLHDPDLWLLDRPFSGLEPPSAQLLARLIETQHRKGRTMVLSTESGVVADSLCDRSFEVQGASILARGRSTYAQEGFSRAA